MSLTEQAAAAVHAYYQPHDDLVQAFPIEHEAAVTYDPLEVAATTAVGKAIKDGATPAQIAAKAQVRQALVIPFIDDPVERMQALAVAYHDAERYAGQVRDAQKTEALQQVGLGRPKAQVARMLGISRSALDAWLAAS